MVNICLTFGETAKMFSYMAFNIPIKQSVRVRLLDTHTDIHNPILGILILLNFSLILMGD